MSTLYEAVQIFHFRMLSFPPFLLYPPPHVVVAVVVVVVVVVLLRSEGLQNEINFENDQVSQAREA